MQKNGFIIAFINEHWQLFFITQGVWSPASMEIPNEEQSDNTIILLQNLIYSYLN